MLALCLARQVALRSAVCAVQVRAKTSKAAPKKAPQVTNKNAKGVAMTKGASQRAGSQKAAAKSNAAAMMARESKKSAVAKAKKARVAMRAASVKENAVAKVQARKAAAQKKAARKAKIASSGPSSAWNLFIAKEAKGKGKVSLKALHSLWTGLSAAKKTAFEAEAAKNRVKRKQIRQSLKGPASKYALFTKANFAGAYAAALKQTSDRKQAFRLAAQAVAKKYKSQ